MYLIHLCFRVSKADTFMGLLFFSFNSSWTFFFSSISQWSNSEAVFLAQNKVNKNFLIFILRGDETNCNLIPKVMDMYLVQKVDLNAVKTKNKRKNNLRRYFKQRGKCLRHLLADSYIFSWVTTCNFLSLK